MIDRCEHTRRGVYVDGSTAGSIIDVCIAPVCPKHGMETNPHSVFQQSHGETTDRAGAAEARRAEDEEREFQLKVTAQVELEIARQLIAKTRSIGRAELTIIAALLHRGQECPPEVLDFVAEHFTKYKIPHPAAPFEIFKRIRKMSEPDLAKYITVLIGSDPYSTAAKEMIRLRKVDQKAIEKKVRAELTKQAKLQTSANKAPAFSKMSKAKQ